MNCTLFCVLILLPEVFRPASVTTTYRPLNPLAIPLGAEFAGSEIVGGFTDGWPDEVNGLLRDRLGDSGRLYIRNTAMFVEDVVIAAGGMRSGCDCSLNTDRAKPGVRIASAGALASEELKTAGPFSSARNHHIFDEHCVIPDYSDQNPPTDLGNNPLTSSGHPSVNPPTISLPANSAPSGNRSGFSGRVRRCDACGPEYFGQQYQYTEQRAVHQFGGRDTHAGSAGRFRWKCSDGGCRG